MRLFSLILLVAGLSSTISLRAQNVTINCQSCGTNDVAAAVTTINANSGVIGNLTINESTGAITDLSPLSAILMTVTGNLTIHNIGDISASATSITWSTLSNVNGNVNIGGTVATGNTKLSSVSFPGLVTVDGTVTVQNNTGLGSINFSNLSMIDASLVIRSNAGLTSINMPLLFTINDDLQVYDNDNLTAFSLSGLLDANSVQIQQNGALQTISLPLLNTVTTNLIIQGTTGNFQPNLQTVTIGNSLDIGGDLIITNNASTSLTALNLGNVETVGGSVTLDNDDFAPAVIVNLSGLTSVGSNFTARDMPQNLNINSLAMVTGNFSIQSNGTLNNITASAFTNTTFGGNLTVTDNTNLSDCCIFSCDVLGGVAGTVNISGNASGCSSVANIAQTCMDAFTGNLTITAKSQIDNFCYSIINGDLVIDGAGIGDAALIANLNGMTSLTQVTGNLVIANLPNLTSLGGTANGLVNLASIGGDFTLNNLELLVNVGNGTTNGLKSLTTIGGSLEVSDNDELANLNGLANLASLSGSLNILSNPDLIDVDGISSAVAGAMGIMDFVLDNNPLLASLGTLELDVNGDLRVKDNGQLDDLGLVNFIAGGANDLEFINNDDLLSFSSLTITGTVVNNLSVSNSDLNDASALAALTTINGDFLFEENDQVSGIPGANFNVMGGIQVIGNALLTTLDWFSSTTALSGSLIIRDNNMLGGLSSFSSLTSVGGDFEINDADQLTDLDDFSALMSASGNVTVTDNDMLAACCVVPCKLEATASSVTVNNNTGNCLNLATAQGACNISGININAIPEVCAGEQATVTVTGLQAAPATYTLEYTIDGVAQTAVTGLTAAANTFLTRVLNNADNGVNLVVTSVTRTDQAIDCSQTTGFTTRVLDVKPIPTINAIADMSYCEGESVSILLSDVTSSASTDYSWSGGADVGISDDTGIGSGTATITGTASGSPLPITRTISVDATLNGCVAPTETFDVTVNPIPMIGTYAPGGPAGPEDISLEAVAIPGLTPPNDLGSHICSGEAFDIEVTTTRDNIRLKWEVISIGNSGVSGYTIGDMNSHFFASAGTHSFTGSGANLMLTDIIRRNVAFELTPIYDPDGIDNNGDECIGTPIQYRIRVWPKIEASFSNTGASVLCSGTDITGQLEISQTTAFSESDPSADGSIVYDIVIAPNPDIAELVGGVNLSNVGNGATDGDPGVDPVADLGIPATLTSTSGSAQTVTIEVTPKFLSTDANAPECSGATQMITLTVEPQPDLAVNIIAPAPGGVIDENNTSYSATVCSGTAFEATSSTSVTAPSGANQLWVEIELDDPTGALGFGSGMQTINVPQSLLAFPNTPLLNAGNSAYTITATLTPYIETDLLSPGLDIDECAGTSLSFSVTVEPVPVIELNVTVGATNATISSTGTTNLTETVCSGADFEAANNSPAQTVAPGNAVFVQVDVTDADDVLGLAPTPFPQFVPISAVGFTLQQLTHAGPGAANIMATLTPYIETTPGTPGLDPGECTGTAVSFDITINPLPVVSATIPALPFGGGIYAACSDEDFTIEIDGTGNPVGTTYSVDWSLSALFGTPNLGLISGTGDFATKPTTPTTSTSITGSFINPSPNENSVQADLTITAETPDGCTETYVLTLYLRPEIFITGIAPGLPATICSGDNVPIELVSLNLSGGTRSIDWGWSGTNISATPPNGTDGTDPFQVPLTTLTNSGGTIETATLSVTPTLSYVSPANQQCVGPTEMYTTDVDPGPSVDNQTAMACSDAAIGVTLGASTNSVAVATYNVSVMNNNGLSASSGPTIGSGLGAGAIANDAWANTTGADVDVIYEVVPVSSNGCEGEPFTVTATIKSAPVLNIPGAPVQICSDSDLSEGFAAVAATNGLTITSITVNSISGIGSLTPDAGNITTPDSGAPDFFLGDSYTNLSNGGINVTYNITATADNGCTATGNYVFRILGEPVLDPNLDKTVCSGQPIEVTLGLDVIGFQTVSGYDILSITPEPGLVAGGGNVTAPLTNQADNVIFNDEWINGSGGQLNVVYEIAPRRTGPGAGCLGDPVMVTVTIDPGPNVTNQTAMACSDAAISVTLGASTNSVAVDEYTLVSVAPGMGLTPAIGNAMPGSGYGDDVIENDSYTNTTNGTIDVIYTFVPVSVDGCEGPAFTVTVTIKPEPVVPFQNGMACSDVAINITLGNSNPFVSTFQITSIDANGLTASAGNPHTGVGFTDDEILDDAWTNTTNAIVNVVYTVVPVSLDGCPGDLFTVTVMVKPEPVVADQDKTLCSDEASLLTLGDDPDGPSVDTYNITDIDDGGLTASAGSPATGTGFSASVIENDAWTNTTNGPLDVVYTVVPVSIDGCEGDPFTVTLTIKPEPVVSNETAGVCSDEMIGVVLPGTDADGLTITAYDIDAEVAMGLSGPATTGMNIMNVNAIAADVFTNTTNGPLDVEYTVTPYADGCPGADFTITVTISPEPVVANVSTINICSDDVIGYVLPAMDDDGLAITGYDISASVDVGLSGTATEGVGITDVNAIANDVFTNLTNGGLPVVYTITPYSNGCVGASFTVTFNIRAEPVLDPGLDKMVCSDEPVDVILDIDNASGFQSVTGYDIISVTPDPGLVAGMGNLAGPFPLLNQADNVFAGDTWTNTTTGVLNVVYRVAPRRSFDCVGDEVDITVMIKPEPVVANQTGAACSDAAIGIILGNDVDGPAAATYNITNINPNGLTASAGSPAVANMVPAGEIANDAWANTANASVDVIYTVVPVSGDGCEGDPFTVTVTIQPEPVVAFQTKTVCSDEALNLNLGNDPNGPPVVFYDITGINSNGLTASAGNPHTGTGLLANEITDDAWTNTTNAPVFVIYSLIPYGSNGCPGNSFAVTITVNPEPVVANQTAMACSDAAIGVTLGDDVDGPSAATYNITNINANGLTASAGSPAVANMVLAGEIADDAWMNTTNAPVDVVYTVVPVSSDGCAGTAFTVTVTIKPEPVVANFTDGVCSDVAIGTLLPDLDDDGLDITTYDVSASVDPMLSGTATTATGTSDVNLIAADIFTNATNGPLDVVYTVTPYSDGCVGTAFTITVTISPEPVVANVPVFNICSGDVISYVLPSTDDDGLALTSYDISAAVNVNLSGIATEGTGITDVNAIAADVFTNLTNAGHQVVYTITPYANGCVGTPFTVTVNIRPEPVLANKTGMACSDVPIGYVLPNMDDDGLNLTSADVSAVVDPSLTGTASTGTGITNANFIANDQFTNTTNGPLDVVYTVTPYRLGCPGDPFTITITIKPEPVVANQTGSACSDAPIGILLGNDVDGPAAASYNITNINPNGLTASAGSPVVANMVTAGEIANDAWTNATNASVDVIYTVVPVSADDCEGDPFTVTVTIQPEPVVAFQTKTVCSDEALNLNLGNDVDGPPVVFYDITNINSNGLVASAGSPATGMALPPNVIADDAWTNTGSMPVDVVYTVIPYGTNGCPGNAFAVTITVNPEPVVANQSDMACSDAAIGITLNPSSSVAAASYNVTVFDDGGLTASNGPTTGTGLSDAAIANDAWTNTTNAPVDVVYSVVPVSSAGCEGTAFTVTVTIKPEPVVANFTDGVCSDVAIGTLLPDLDDDGLDITTYDVSASVDPMLSGTATTATGTSDVNLIAADIFTNAANGPLNVVYTVTPYSDGCVGTAFTITVTISPEPVVANVSTINVCSDEALGYVLPATDNDGLAITSYDISAAVNVDLSGIATEGVGITDVNAIANDAFTNLSPGGRTVVYTITPYSNGCVGASFTVTFNIRAEPVLDPNLNTMVCSDEAVGVILDIDNTIGFQTVTGYDIISVTPDGGLVAGMGNLSGPFPLLDQADNVFENDTWTNTTNGVLNVVYRVAPRRNNGCVGDEVDIVVMIKPEPVVANQTGAACSDAAIGIILGNDVDGPAAATYNITNINPNGLTASAGTPTFPANGVGAGEIADDAWTNATNASVNVVYTVVPVSADGCEGDPFTVTVTIQPEPVVAFQTKTVCSDEVLNLILGNDPNGPPVAFYDITNINSNGLVASAGSPATGIALPDNVIADDAWANETMSPVNVIYTVIPYGTNGCPGNPFAVTITVNPEPVVANQTGMACSDEEIMITLGASTSVAAATYDITNINANGLTASAGAPTTGTGFADSEISNDAWTNTTNDPVDVIYTVVPVSGDDCEGNPFTVTVTIKPEPVVASFTDGACSDVAIGTVLPDLDDDGLDITKYDIDATVDPNLMGTPTTGFDITDVNAIAMDAFTNATNGPLDVVYTITPYAGDCAGTDFMITVTISPEPVVMSFTDMSCSGLPINTQLPAVDDDGLVLTSYDITAVVDGNLSGTATEGTGLTNVDAIAGDVFTNTTNASHDVVYTVTPYTNGCVGTAFTITVTIKPEPVVMSFTGMACSDVAIGTVLPSTDDDGLGIDSYDISAVVDGSLSGTATTGTGIIDVNAIAMDAFTNTTNATHDVVYTVTPYTDGCAGDPFTITITIKPEPVVANQAQSVCSDVASFVILGASTNGTAAATYNITSIVNNGLIATAGSPMTGTGFSNLEIVDDAWRNQGVSPVNVVYTVVPVSPDGCEGDAFTVTLTVSPEPVLDVPGSPIALCSDEPLSSAWGGITTINAQPLSYISLINVTDNTASPNFTPNPGNATFPASPVAVDYFDNDSYTNLTSGGVIVSYEVVGVTPGGCASDPVTFQFQIRAEPVLNPNLDKTICSGANTDITLSVDPTIGFQTPNGFVIDDITVDAGLVGDPGNVMIGDILTSPFLLDDTWTNDTDGPLTVTYSIIPRRANGCFGDAALVVVTVEPTPVASLDVTYNASTVNVNADDYPVGSPYQLMFCSGETLDAVGVSTVVPTPGSELWVQVELTDPDDVLGYGTSATFNVPYGQLIFNQAIVNTTNAPYVITAVITPYVEKDPMGSPTLDAEDCEGEAFELEITIKPEPVAVATPSDTEICDDGSFTVGLETNGTSIAADHYLVTTAVSDPGLTQTSGNVTVGGTVMLAGPTNTISGTFSNATTSTQTVTYTIVPVSADGCEGDAITVEVDVWARPVTMPGPAAICLGDITDILPNVTQGSGTSVSNYAWTYLGATATNFNVNDPPVFPLFPNLTVINTENLAIDVSSPLAGQGLIGFSLVVTDDNGCTSLPQNIFVMVQAPPNPGISASVGPVCEDFGSINLFDQLGGTPNGGGAWTADPGNPAGGTLIGPNFNPSGSVGGTYLFTYTVTNAGCGSVSSTVTVEVSPNADAGTFDILADNDVCEDEPTFDLFSLLNGYDVGGTWTELTSSGAGLNPMTGELDLSTALPGNYTFRYSVTAPGTICPNPSDAEDVVLNIIALPASNPILGNDMPCVNTTANYALTTPVIPGVTRLWSLSGGGTITSGTTGNTVTVDWGSTPGMYTLTLEETRLGCTTVNTLEVEVKATEAGFTYVVGSMDGLTINFSDASVGSNLTIWFWDFGDGNTSLDQNPIHAYASTGTYTVCLDVVGDCGSDQYCEDVIITSMVTCDDVPLNDGLNLMSIDVEPTDPSIESIFASQISGSELIYVQGRNSSGAIVIFDPLLIPFPGLNTLTEFEPGKGYYVRMNTPLGPTTLTVCGTPIDPNYRPALNATWNIVGYVPQVSTTPEDFFADLIPPMSNNLQIARGFDGSFKFFDPLLIPFPGLNTLTSIDNGFGYELRVNSAVAEDDWLLGPEEVEQRTGGGFVSDRYMVVAAKSNLPDTYSGQYVSIITADGYEIGQMEILPGGLLLTTPIYGNDSYTEEQGVQDGSWLYLRFQGETVPLNLQFHADRSINFVEVSFDVVSKVDTQNAELVSISVAPNPFSSTAQIVLDLGKDSDISWVIRDAFGRVVEAPQKMGWLRAGRYTIEWMPENIASGVYTIQLLADDVLVGNHRVVYHRK